MDNLVGNRIRQLRTRADYGQRTMSKEMGYKTHNYLYQIERGMRLPSDDFLERFSKALALSDDDKNGLYELVSGTRSKSLSETERQLSDLLIENGIITGAYTGKLSEQDMLRLIESIKKWGK